MKFSNSKHNFGIRLHGCEAQEFSTKVQMTGRLISSKETKNGIEKSTTADIDASNMGVIYGFISWKELLKPQNEFVKNGSISFEMKIIIKKVANLIQNEEDSDATSSTATAKRSNSNAPCAMAVSRTRAFLHLHAVICFVRHVSPMRSEKTKCVPHAKCQPR